MAEGYIVGATTSEKALLEEHVTIETGADLLNLVSVGSYCNFQSVVFVESDASAFDVIKTLAENKIQSVPVRADNKKEHFAFIDTLDILVHVLNVADRTKAEGLTAEASQQAFDELNAEGLANLSKRDPFSPIGLDTPLQIALEKFVKWDAHRLPVIDSDGAFEMVLSQMGVLEFLQQHAGKFHVSKKTIGELKLGYKPVCSVTESDPVVRAFSLMKELGITGLAVVDEKGAPTSGISITDIKRIFSDDGKLDLSALELTVGDFKKKSYSDKDVIPGPVHIRPDVNVEEVLLKFIVSRVHRLFVIDNGEIVGIVSVIDLLNALKTHK